MESVGTLTLTKCPQLHMFSSSVYSARVEGRNNNKTKQNKPEVTLNMREFHVSLSLAFFHFLSLSLSRLFSFLLLFFILRRAWNYSSIFPVWSWIVIKSIHFIRPLELATDILVFVYRRLKSTFFSTSLLPFGRQILKHRRVLQRASLASFWVSRFCLRKGEFLSSLDRAFDRALDLPERPTDLIASM